MATATTLLAGADGKTISAETSRLSSQVYTANTPADICAALDALAAHLRSVPTARARMGKSAAIDLGISKRSADPTLWTRACALRFAAVLAAFSLPSDVSMRDEAVHVEETAADPDSGGFVRVTFGNGKPPASEGDAGVAPPTLPVTTPGDALVPPVPPSSGNSSRVHTRFGLPRSASLADLFNTRLRRIHLLQWSVAVAAIFLVIVIASIATGRSFGFFFAANIVLLGLAGWSVFLSLQPSRFNKFHFNVLIVGNFMALAGGALTWLVYIGAEVKDKVDSYCLRNPETCAGYSASQVQSAAYCACVILMIGYITLYFIGLRFAYDYCEAMTSALHVTRPTCFDSSVALIGQFSVPGRGCVGSWRHCSAVGAQHTCECVVLCATAPGKCAGACCESTVSACFACLAWMVPDGVDGSKCCMATFCLFVIAMAIVSSVLCVALDSAIWCVISDILIRGIITFVFSSSSSSSNDDW